MPRAVPRVSSTRMTGSPSRQASAALLSLPSAAIPSCSPWLPSTMLAAAPAQARSNEARTSSQPAMYGSRLRQARPAASASHIGSM